MKTFIPISQKLPDPGQKVDLCINLYGRLRIVYFYNYKNDKDNPNGFYKMASLDPVCQITQLSPFLFYYSVKNEIITHWAPTSGSFICK